jgi:two-component system cell cycle sensor histidine kinase/response regulator CckA
MARGTLELLPDGVLQLDAGDMVVYANRAARELLGGDPVGRAIGRLRVKRPRDPLEMGVWRRLDGGVIELEASSAQHGGLELLTLRDMSAQATRLQTLRRERDQLQAVVDALPTMVVVLNRKRLVERANAVLERVTGCPPDRLIGRPDALLELVSDDDRGWLRSGIGRALDGEAVVGDLRFLTPSGARLFEVQLEPLGSEGAVLLARNITREREVLGVFRAQARKEVAQLGLLASSLAQDLNEQLTIVSVAMDGAGTGHQGHSQSNAAMSEARRITRDLLRIGRAGDTEERTPVLVGSLLTRVSERMAEGAPPGVEVRCENALGTARVMGSPVALLRILHQLGVNALKAVNVAGQIWLRGHVIEDRVVLDIEDDGVGIPLQVQDRLFEPFGSGARPDLGLALVRSVVQSMGGSIQLQSSRDAGTVFRISLPLHRIEQAPARVEPEVRALPAHVLLVEDNEAVMDGLERMLSAHDVRIVRAQDGVEAVQKAGQHPELELVLLDVGLPGLGGEEVLQRLRQRHPDLPVLMMSGFASSDRIQACLQAGAVGFIGKPFRLAELRAALEG